jgi:hypothetical protein
MITNIWYQSIPIGVPGTAVERPGVITRVPEGTVVLADDVPGPANVVGFDPTGVLGFTANHQVYELMSVDPGINTLNYPSSGVPFKVFYRAR